MERRHSRSAAQGYLDWTRVEAVIGSHLSAEKTPWPWGFRRPGPGKRQADPTVALSPSLGSSSMAARMADVSREDRRVAVRRAQANVRTADAAPQDPGELEGPWRAHAALEERRGRAVAGILVRPARHRAGALLDEQGDAPGIREDKRCAWPPAASTTGADPDAPAQRLHPVRVLLAAGGVPDPPGDRRMRPGARALGLGDPARQGAGCPLDVRADLGQRVSHWLMIASLDGHTAQTQLYLSRLLDAGSPHPRPPRLWCSCCAGARVSVGQYNNQQPTAWTPTLCRPGHKKGRALSKVGCLVTVLGLAWC